MYTIDLSKVALPIRESDTKTKRSIYDYRRFNSFEEALEYKANYLFAFEKIKSIQHKIDKSLPAMIYKRRYLIQTFMGEKMQTVRDYQKLWKVGQKFNLYDQTYFLTVELLLIEENKKTDEFTYFFKEVVI